MDNKVKAFKENIPKVILREATLFLVVGLAYYFNYLTISKEFITNLSNFLWVLFYAIIIIQFYWCIFKKSETIPFEKEFSSITRLAFLMSMLAMLSFFK